MHCSTVELLPWKQTLNEATVIDQSGIFMQMRMTEGFWVI